MTSIPDLRVHLRGPDRERFEGLCTDLDSNEHDVHASVVFAGSPAPVLTVGKTAQLSFRGGGLLASIDAEALAVSRNDDQVRRRYSFTLLDVPKELLFVLANRRDAPRVRPGEEGLRVRLLHVGGLGGEVELHDMSASGLSVLLRPAVEERLSNTTQIQLELTLPEADSALHLHATIRNRRLCGASILYGLQFDRRTPRFVEVQRQISEYLATFGC